MPHWDYANADMPIWKIASPLKLSEYLAAGLAIIGPSHQGNRLRGDEIWDLSSEDRDWPLQSIDKIRKHILEERRK